MKKGIGGITIVYDGNKCLASGVVSEEQHGSLLRCIVGNSLYGSITGTATNFSSFISMVKTIWLYIACESIAY